MELYLKSVDIKNFCGIKHYYNEFADGLNIIIGKFGSGKTTIIKSLKWALGLNVKNYEPVVEENNRIIKLKVVPSVSWVLRNEYFDDICLYRVGNKMYFNEIECKTQKEYIERILRALHFDNLDRLEQCLFLESYLDRPQIKVRNDILCLINAKNVLNDLIMQDKYDKIKMLVQEFETNDEISKFIKNGFKDFEQQKQDVKDRIILMENLIKKLKGEVSEKGEKYLLDFKTQLENCLDGILKNEIDYSKKEQLFNEYIVESANMLEKTANNAFLEVGWQLFSTRKTNNELYECCEMIYYDKPFSCLSRGEQLKALISLHYELLQFYHNGGRVPLIIDNATDLGRENIIGNEQIILFETQNEEMKGIER